MARTIDTTFVKSAPAKGAAHGAPFLSMLRGRRKDDAIFMAIAAVLAGLFVIQLAWVISMKAHG